jgi:hypothetical protein
MKSRVHIARKLIANISAIGVVERACLIIGNFARSNSKHMKRQNGGNQARNRHQERKAHQIKHQAAQALVSSRQSPEHSVGRVARHIMARAAAVAAVVHIPASICRRTVVVARLQ